MGMRSALALLLPVLLAPVGSSMILPTTVAFALPPTPSCSITIYFNDKHHDEIVGKTAACPGSPYQATGARTRYFIIEDSNAPAPIAAATPGNLPCEFLQAGCSSWRPEPHH
jgi:hypothetical protein